MNKWDIKIIKLVRSVMKNRDLTVKIFLIIKMCFFIKCMVITAWDPHTEKLVSVDVGLSPTGVGAKSQNFTH